MLNWRDDLAYWWCTKGSEILFIFLKVLGFLAFVAGVIALGFLMYAWGVVAFVIYLVVAFAAWLTALIYAFEH